VVAQRQRLHREVPRRPGALAAQVGIDRVLDGEMVVWTGERLDFEPLGW
jgi:hypothetical protein